MSLPMRDVVGILGDNLRLRGSVLPISARKATRWTEGLELPVVATRSCTRARCTS